MEAVWHMHVGDVEHRMLGVQLIGAYMQVPWQTSLKESMFRRGTWFNRAAAITAISENVPYNDWLASEVIKGVQAGRRVLVCSHRTAQLADIRARILAKNSTVSVGYYAGEVEKVKITPRQLEAAIQCQAILATYAKMSEGTDIPWLDTLYFATPGADVEQVVGRIQRVEENKKSLLVVDPVWNLPFCRKLALSRLKVYQKLGFRNQAVEMRVGVSNEWSLPWKQGE